MSGANITMRVLFFLTLMYIPVAVPSTTDAEAGDKSAKETSSVGGYDGEPIDYPGQTTGQKTPAGTDNSGSPIFPAVWCANITDSKTQVICWDAYREGLAYYKRGLLHRTDAIKWQHISTQIIFFTVLFLVGSGIYFAWVQFKNGTGSQENNEIEISMQGIKVSSPVLGVIILVLSLAFFYLYLRYVYPINEII
ncbi:MAG: hypothetical protein GY934_04060 [Gammaproteobacteria bacterium]|nr:hypothetical protein [Gammaproteobacteria bacterium]